MANTPRRIYLDYAATSSPKAPGVADAVLNALSGAAPGRGQYAEAQHLGNVIWQTRQDLCKLIGAPDKPEQIIFTLNGTDALNIAIKGVLARLPAGKEIVCTSMDHNSVLRPLNEWQSRGHIQRIVISSDAETGIVDPDIFIAALNENTALAIVNHCSNICGALQDIQTIGQACKERNIPFLVDAAQSLGHVAIDVESVGCDMLAAPGHKGLLGPQGTGFLWIRPGFEENMLTMREGGTGTRSEQDVQPRELPDRFEPGCPNGPGIAGLGQSVKWLLSQGQRNIEHTQSITKTFADGLAQMTHIKQIGTPPSAQRTPVFCIQSDAFDTPLALSEYLESHGLLTRPGFHCAPLAHQTLGSQQAGGAVRISFGSTSTLEEVQQTLLILSQLEK